MTSFLKRIVHKFYYAFCGLFHGIAHDKSIRLQFLLAMLTILCGMLVGLDLVEWSIVLILIGLVVAMEYINSVVEAIVDVLFPHYDPRAKMMKDYSAAAVLVLSIVALVLGIVILGGKLWTILM